MRWYVSKNGESSGPHEEATVAEWARANQLKGAMLRDEAASAWVPLAQTPFSALQPQGAVPKTGAAAPAHPPNVTLVEAIVVIALGVFAVYAYATCGSSSKSNAPPALPDPAPMTVTIGSLLAEYDDNEVRADTIYKGRVVRFSGFAASIGADIMKEPYVIVSETKGGVRTVQCVAAASAVGRVSLLQRGDAVNVTGKISGRLGNLIIRECVFE